MFMTCYLYLQNNLINILAELNVYQHATASIRSKYLLINIIFFIYSYPGNPELHHDLSDFTDEQLVKFLSSDKNSMYGIFSGNSSEQSSVCLGSPIQFSNTNSFEVTAPDNSKHQVTCTTVSILPTCEKVPLFNTPLMKIVKVSKFAKDPAGLSKKEIESHYNKILNKYLYNYRYLSIKYR